MPSGPISMSDLAAAKSAIAAGTFKSKKVAVAPKPVVVSVRKAAPAKSKTKPVATKVRKPVRKPIASAMPARPNKKSALAMWGEALKRDA